LKKSVSGAQIYYWWRLPQISRHHPRVRALFALQSGFAGKSHCSITDGYAYKEVIVEGNNILVTLHGMSNPEHYT